MRLQASIDITLRFKEAFEYVRSIEGRGMKARFCRENGINTNQLNALLKRPDTRTLPPYYIACLCVDYGVSANYILMDEGAIMRKKKAANNHHFISEYDTPTPM